MPIPRIYLAPMEGVTTFIYRNAHAAVYGPLDKYFTPFLEPHEKRSMKTKERNEVLSQLKDAYLSGTFGSQRRVLTL